MIKVGLLLDSLDVPVWQLRIIDFIKEHASFSIELIILNDEKVVASNTNRLVYKLLRKLDRTLFKVAHDNFTTKSVNGLVSGVEIIRVKPHRLKFTDEILSDDVKVIHAKDLDILIRFGFRILKGQILTCTRYGVWSLHHGDNAVNRGGPPAFWEVVRQDAVTGVTLQFLTENLDGGKVLGKAFVKTDVSSFNRNQNATYWAGVELFCGKLEALAKVGTDQFFHNVTVAKQPLSFYSNTLYRDPGNFKALKIFFVFGFRQITRYLFKLWYTQQWCLYYRKSNTTFDSSLFHYKQLIPRIKDIDWADPFVFFKDEKYYVFIEELVKKKGKAHISCFIFNSQGSPLTKEPQVILEEPFHLSYPFVFEFEGSVYMMPERASTKSVWLYKCNSFPDQWASFKEILQHELYDPTLLLHEGYWYLFGTQKPYEGNSPHQYLYIYYTDNLMEGNFKPHPMNPVTRDVRGARPAGKIFKHNDKLIRPSQIGAPKYGYGISFQEIVKLSPTVYEEKQLEEILPHWKDELLATHTFNFTNGFSIVDAQLILTRYF